MFKIIWTNFDRTMLFDSIIATIANYYENVAEDLIEENDLEDLTDVSELSELSETEDEEQQQRKIWAENQRLLKEKDKNAIEDDFREEIEARNDSIALNYLLEKESAAAREKAHIEKKEKKREEEKAFEIKVEKIIMNLKNNDSFEFSMKLSQKKRQIIYELCKVAQLINLSL